MSIHTEFLASTPRCVHGDALAGGVQFIAKEIIKGMREPKQAAKDILKIVGEYFEGRTDVDPQVMNMCRAAARQILS
ncbi:hypothetical protein [Pelotomaculum schinkii]|uniref:hypothetical protein n=1 Tax=Pelotomaculum schinkii TaxID=78350 RepID=UPI00167DEEFE|nr:hypothetical protein [Pelotomaculum schinkii]